MDIPKCVGVIAHSGRPKTFPVASHITETLRANHIDVWRQDGWDNGPAAHQLQKTDMVVAIGGDGAMLRAARTCAAYSIPVLGVNMGYLGFLPEISTPDAWDAHLALLLDGDYWVERRMTLQTVITREGKVLAKGDALNDVVITRNQAIGTVLLQTYIDGHWATTYHADALIIATATGSTAYALAAGGPILPPNLHNILIVAVAPHLSMNRPIVLSEGSSVQVVVSEERPSHAIVILDGTELCDIEPSDSVNIQVGENHGLFVRMQDRSYFYRSLLDRLEPRVPSRSMPVEQQIDVNLPNDDVDPTL